jgi:hypothetical protein
VLIVLGIGIAVLSQYLGAPFVFASEAFELDTSVGRDVGLPDPATWQAALHGQGNRGQVRLSDEP